MSNHFCAVEETGGSGNSYDYLGYLCSCQDEMGPGTVTAVFETRDAVPRISGPFMSMPALNAACICNGLGCIQDRLTGPIQNPQSAGPAEAFADAAARTIRKYRSVSIHPHVKVLGQWNAKSQFGSFGYLRLVLFGVEKNCQLLIYGKAYDYDAVDLLDTLYPTIDECHLQYITTAGGDISVVFGNPHVGPFRIVYLAGVANNPSGGRSHGEEQGVGGRTSRRG